MNDMELRDYFEALYKDIPFQFKGKPRIKGLLFALSRQLAAVRDFYLQLSHLLEIDNQEGVQLDGIGDIVQITRADAIAAMIDTSTVTMDDESYRKWLKYKIAVNTSNGTYRDLMNAIEVLLGKQHVTYSETPDRPATALFDITNMDNPDFLSLALLMRIKSAGVRLSFTTHMTLESEIYVGSDDYERTLWSFDTTANVPPSVTPVFIASAAFCRERYIFSISIAAEPPGTTVFIGAAQFERYGGEFSIETSAGKRDAHIYFGSSAFIRERITADYVAPAMTAAVRAGSTQFYKERMMF